MYLLNSYLLEIKKKISLDFLGDDYKEGYLIFKSMPIKEFEEFQKTFINNNLKRYNEVVERYFKN